MAADDGDRFFHIIELAAALFEDGAPVVAARTLVGGMAEMSRLERRLSCHVLRAGIRQAGRWTGSERAAVRAELNRLPASGSLASEHRTLISLLDAAPPREPGTPVIGRANVLVTARDDGVGQYGRVVHLDVFVRPGGGSIRFEQAGDDLAQFRGFYQGVLAAEEYLLRRTRGSLAAALYLRAGSVRGLVPVLRRGSRLSGASLGLSTAMAALSAFLNLGLPEDVAFTGGVDPRGRVDPVGDVAVKLQAAKERGIGRVYIPSGNADAVTGLDGPDLDVVTVATVDDVASQAWTSGEMERSLDRLHRIAPAVSEAPALDIERSAGTRRALLSWVGRADPFGEYPDAAGGDASMEVVEEGPILTLCRILRPDAVFLFHTSAPDRWSDFTDRAAEVERVIGEMLPGATVHRRPLPAVQDPSDYGQLVPVLRREASGIVAAASREADPTEFVVNLSSGSPQMETTWHLLKAWRVIPARLFQVREARFAGAGEARVREVVLPAYT